MIDISLVSGVWGAAVLVYVIIHSLIKEDSRHLHLKASELLELNLFLTVC